MSRESKPHRLSLIHQTDLQSAEKIISTQKMLPGAAGLFGPGIYFANTIEAANLKARRKGVFLIADVYYGRSKKVSKKEATSGKLDFQKIQAQGYNSIFGYKMPTGREIVVFDSDRVKNIKFIYGTRPQAVFSTDRDRITLFFVTDKETAAQIHEDQEIPRINNGPLGTGYYMYDTISEAKQVNPLGNTPETYLAADVYMKDYHRLERNEKADDRRFRRHCRSFTGKANGIVQFVLTDPRLISCIHYCGGKPFG